MTITTASLQRLIKQTEKIKSAMTRSLLKTLRKIDQERKERTADLDEAARVITAELGRLGHKVLGDGAAPRARGGRKPATKSKRRIRRSADQLKVEAERVVAMIRKAGKEGIGGAQIRRSHPGVGQNIKSFVEKHTGQKLKTTGAKASMKYHL